MKTIKSIVLLGVCLLANYGVAVAAPPVLIKIDGNVHENGLFSGQTIQDVPFSLLGSEVSFGSVIQPIQTASSGMFSGATSVDIQGSNGGVTLQRNTSLTFTYVSGGDIIGDVLSSNIALQFYVLGGPGTAFSWSAHDGGAATFSNGTSNTYEDAGYSSPGLAFDWGFSGGNASGTGSSTNNTLIFGGDTYSLVNIAPSLVESVNFGFSPRSANGSVQGAFSMTVRNLSVPAVPEPTTCGIVVAAAVALLLLTRRHTLRQQSFDR